MARRSASDWRRVLSYNSDFHEQSLALKAVQKDRREGRSKREPEAYIFRYVEGLSEARTNPTVLFNRLTYFSCQALTRLAVITPSTRSIAFNT